MASNTKPNSSRKRAIALSVGDLCFTCGLEGDWSKDVNQHAPHAMTLGHVVAVEVGGTNTPDNLGAQCAACNYGANYRKITNQTGTTLEDGTGFAEAWIATKRALEIGCPQDNAPKAYPLPGKDERKAARKARGLNW